jgi:DNA excision repair protein ERCC-5
VAPLEAEAQCAKLEELQLVDGVITDDSDVFLFGGRSIYRHFFSQNKMVESYLVRDIERELGLTRQHMVALSQLMGSDYAEGISGVGAVTAVEILTEFGDASTIELDPHAVLEKFATWLRGAQRGEAPEARESTFKKRFVSW